MNKTNFQKVKPGHCLGLFNNGRASIQVENRGCEFCPVVWSFRPVTHPDVVPDLTFCEMAFLKGKDKKNSLPRTGTRSDRGDNKKSSRVGVYLPPTTRESGCNQQEIRLLAIRFDDHESALLGTTSDSGVNTLCQQRSVDVGVLDEILPQAELCHDCMNTPAVTQVNVQEHKSDALINESSTHSAPDEIQTSRSELEYVSNSAELDVEVQTEELQNPETVCTAPVPAEERIWTNNQVKQTSGIGMITVCEYSQNKDRLSPSPSPLSRLLRDCDDLLSHEPDLFASCPKAIDTSSYIPHDSDCQPLQSKEVKPDQRFISHSGSLVVESDCKTTLPVEPLPVSIWKSYYSECLDHHNFGELRASPTECDQVTRVVSSPYNIQSSQDFDTLNDFEGNSWHSDISYTCRGVDREMGGHFGDVGSSLRLACGVAQTCMDNGSAQLGFSWKPYWRV